MEKQSNKALSKFPHFGGIKGGSLQLIVATLLCISGLVLLFWGMLIPPSGTIDSSLLIAFGEISTFSGALFGVDYCYRKSPPQSPRKGDSSISSSL